MALVCKELAMPASRREDLSLTLSINGEAGWKAPVTPALGGRRGGAGIGGSLGLLTSQSS